MRPWWLLVLVLPGAMAGTPDAPEIEDPADDSVSSISLFGAPAADILAAWFFEDDAGLHVSIRLGAPVCADPSESIEYHVHFDFQKASAFFGAVISAGAGSTGFCPGNAGSTTIRPTGQATAASFEGDTITASLHPGVRQTLGDQMTGLYVTSRAYIGAAAAAAVWSDTDRAPDSGTATFVRAQPAETPNAVYQNVSTPVLTLAANETVERNGTLHTNWTAAPAAAEMAFKVQVGAGRLNVTIHDADGAELFSCACEEDLDDVLELAGAPGNWTVRLDLHGFRGEYRVHLSEAPPAGNGTASPTQTGSAPTTTTSTGTQTTQGGDPPAKDSPLGAALVVAAVAMALVRRRL